MGKLIIATTLLLTGYISKAEDVDFDKPEEVVVTTKAEKTTAKATKADKDLPYSEEELNNFSPEKFNEKSSK